MRRLVLGLSVVLASAGMLLFSACQRTNMLRVVAVNGGAPIYSDVADWFIWQDPTDPEAEPELASVTRDDTVEFQFQYIELGTGLPTWAPYAATIREYTISYESQRAGATYSEVTVPVTIEVPATTANEKTTNVSLLAVPAWWKEEYFDPEEPPTYTVDDAITATFEFVGYDSMAGHDVKANAQVEVEVGNLYDDPTRAGQ